MGDSVTAYVLDAPTRQSPTLVRVKVGFGPGAPPIDANLATFDIRGHDLRFNEISVEREKLEPAFKTEILSFEARRRINVSFAVPRMAAAFKVLDECVVNLLDSWGFSRERQAAMAKGPEPLKPMTAYITPKDYPTEALSGEEAGSNSARYWVDAKGRVSGCTIVESSKSKALDNTLCRVINRIRFRPALDKTGKPMESIGFQRVRWILG
jgi:TonB family protein